MLLVGIPPDLTASDSCPGIRISSHSRVMACYQEAQQTDILNNQSIRRRRHLDRSIAELFIPSPLRGTSLGTEVDADCVSHNPRTFFKPERGTPLLDSARLRRMPSL